MQGAQLQLHPTGSASILPASTAPRERQNVFQPAQAPNESAPFAAPWLEKAKSRSQAQNGRSEQGKPAYHSCFDDVARSESIKLVGSVFPLADDDFPRLVVFAGVDSASSCSWICAHAADTLANRKNRTVCLVDANVETPTLSQLCGAANRYGFSDALGSRKPIRDFAISVRQGSLWLLSGPLSERSGDLLDSVAVRPRLSELRKQFDYVLINCPPLDNRDEAIFLAQLGDGLVLVLDVHSPCRELAASATHRVRSARIKLLGAVLNKRSFPNLDTLRNTGSLHSRSTL